MITLPTFLAAHLDSEHHITSLNPGETNPTSGLTWIHCDIASEPGQTALASVKENFPLTTDDFNKGFFRIGIEMRPEGIAFLVTSPTCIEDPVYRQVVIYATSHLIATVTKVPIPELEELHRLWCHKPQGHGATSSKLLYSILDVCIDSYFPVVDELHSRIDDLEDLIFGQTTNRSADTIRIKKQLLTVRKHVSPIRENVNSLIRIGQTIIHPVDLPEYQDLFNHCLRISENIDLGRDLVSGLMDVQLGITSNRLNEVMRTLTVISTILMSSALIAGIYGMNFSHMPELHWTYGYPLAILSMIVSGAGIYYLFRKLGFIGGN